MKKLLAGLLVLGSFSSFANCNVDIQVKDLANVNVSTAKVTKMAKEILGKKGYTFNAEEPADEMVISISTLQDDLRFFAKGISVWISRGNQTLVYRGGNEDTFLSSKNSIIRKTLKEIENCH